MSIDLSLDRISRLADVLPPYTRPTCHIAGTNGKGSVASLVSSILLASSPPVRIGRFNSPHLVSIYDCVTVDNVPVSQAVYDAVREEVTSADAEHEIGASSFEILTLTALRLFEMSEVDVVVLEVGMGGRLDATNVVPDSCLLVSALAAVDLDHQAFLGKTVQEIAREKAGIARRNISFVLGPQKHAAVPPVVEEVTKKAGARLILAQSAKKTVTAGLGAVSLVPSSFNGPAGQPVRVSIPPLGEIDAFLPLHGAHQLDNLGLATTIIAAILPSFSEGRITPSTVAEGINSTCWPGRLSFHPFPPTGIDGTQMIVLADGAHNPASAETLGTYIKDLLVGQTPISLTFILALSDSPPKTPLQTLRPLSFSSLGEEVDVGVALLRFSPPEGMPWVKSVLPSVLKRVIHELAPNAEIWAAEDEFNPTQLKRALQWAGGREGKEGGRSLVVLAGSLYLVADFYRILLT